MEKALGLSGVAGGAILTDHILKCSGNKMKKLFKNIFLLFFITFLGSCSHLEKNKMYWPDHMEGFVSSTNAQALLKETEKNIAEVDVSIKNFESVKKDIYADLFIFTNSEKFSPYIEEEAKSIYRLASAVLEGFLRDGRTHKIKTEFQGDRETLFSEYYFFKGSLLCAKKTRLTFFPPKWENASKVVKTTETSFYFENGNLSFILENGHQVSLPSADFQKKEQRILKNVEFYQAKLLKDDSENKK